MSETEKLNMELMRDCLKARLGHVQDAIDGKTDYPASEIIKTAKAVVGAIADLCEYYYDKF